MAPKNVGESWGKSFLAMASVRFASLLHAVDEHHVTMQCAKILLGMATRRFLFEIFILNSIQNYTKIINTVLISYRSNNAVSMLFTTWHG